MPDYSSAMYILFLLSTAVTSSFMPPTPPDARTLRHREIRWLKPTLMASPKDMSPGRFARFGFQDPEELVSSFSYEHLQTNSNDYVPPSHVS